MYLIKKIVFNIILHLHIYLKKKYIIKILKMYKNEELSLKNIY